MQLGTLLVLQGNIGCSRWPAGCCAQDKMRVYDCGREMMARLADLGGIASQSPSALAAQRRSR